MSKPPSGSSAATSSSPTGGANEPQAKNLHAIANRGRLCPGRSSGHARNSRSPRNRPDHHYRPDRQAGRADELVRRCHRQIDRTGEAQMTRLFDQMLNSVVSGDCIDVMAHMPWASVDFILTDPPYLVNYRDRSGRRVANDDNDAWLKPAFRQMYRVLRPDSLCVSFYGWNKTDVFMTAWREAGFAIVGHIVFRKRYGSNARFLSYRHESAYLLAKGRPPLPAFPVPNVLEFPYTGNRLHPTQKPVQPLKTLIGAFTKPEIGRAS